MAVDRITQELATAVQWHRAGKLEQAARVYAQLRPRAPRHFDVWHLSGTVALQLGRATEAVTFLTQAHRLNPNDAVCLMRLGLAEMKQGRADAAVARLQTVVLRQPNFAEAWDNLGIARKLAGDLAGGIAAHERAVAIKPSHAQGWYNLGHALIMRGDAAGALAAHNRALREDPQHPLAHYGRGVALQALHRIPEAVAAYEQQLKRDPQHLDSHSSRLLALHYLDTATPAFLAQEHRRFGQVVGTTSTALPPRALPPRLRIGFISPDFRQHAVSSFFEPLLEHLDRERCEIFLYHDHFITDAVTQRLQALSNHWRVIVGQPDQSVEALLRQDQLDVLVDLTGHTGLNRLAVFARRVAPLQVTYLGYPDTTGLAQVDLRLTDALADPPGEADRYATERLVRFSPCAWTWRPPVDAPEVPPLPCLQNGYVTFGSFNNAAKLSDRTLRLWTQILQEVPDSRLLLKAAGLDQESILTPLRARCEATGMPLERVIFRGHLPSAAAHMAAYADIDIALDPTPYNGTTTTCEALWMGRPVITLSGDRHCARVGVSLLSAIGRAEWIAADELDYVRRAVKCAQGVNHSTAIWLREAVAASALRDEKGQSARFLAALEQKITAPTLLAAAAG